MLSWGADIQKVSENVTIGKKGMVPFVKFVFENRAFVILKKHISCKENFKLLLWIDLDECSYFPLRYFDVLPLPLHAT